MRIETVHRGRSLRMEALIVFVIISNEYQVYQQDGCNTREKQLY